MVVLVEHFLNPQGKEYFPAWILTARAVLAQKQGFISINQIEAIENTERTMLMLCFESLRDVKLWAASDEHNELLKELQPFQVKKQISSLYTIVP